MWETSWKLPRGQPMWIREADCCAARSARPGGPLSPGPLTEVRRDRERDTIEEQMVLWPGSAPGRSAKRNVNDVNGAREGVAGACLG